MEPQKETDGKDKEPTKELFGRCPICNAIVSLDCTRNVKCDACHQPGDD